MSYAMFFVLRSTFPHVHMFRSTCLGFYAMFFYVLFLFLFYVDVRVTCSHAWYHVYGYVFLKSTCFYARSMLQCLYPSLHMLVYLDSCPSMSMCLIAMCLHACFYAYMSMSMLPHACVFGSMLSSCFCYIPWACVLHAMFMCLDLGYVCHAMWYYSPFVVLSFFLVFWPSN